MISTEPMTNMQITKLSIFLNRNSIAHLLVHPSLRLRTTMLSLRRYRLQICGLFFQLTNLSPWTTAALCREISRDRADECTKFRALCCLLDNLHLLFLGLPLTPCLRFPVSNLRRVLPKLISQHYKHVNIFRLHYSCYSFH